MLTYVEKYYVYLLGEAEFRKLCVHTVSPNVLTSSRDAKKTHTLFFFSPYVIFDSYQITVGDKDRESYIYATSPPYINVILYSIYTSVQQCAPRAMVGHLTTRCTTEVKIVNID